MRPTGWTLSYGQIYGWMDSWLLETIWMGNSEERSVKSKNPVLHFSKIYVYSFLHYFAHIALNKIQAFVTYFSANFHL